MVRHHLRLGRGNARVAGNDFLGHPAHRLQPQREGNDVEEQHLVLASLIGEEVGLDRRAHRNHLVWVDIGQGLLPEQLGDVGADRGNSRRAADQDDALHVGGGHARVLERPLDRHSRLLEPGADPGLEVGPADGHRVALEPDVGSVDGGEGLLGCPGQQEQRGHLRVVGPLQPELSDHLLDDGAIEIIAAQRGVASHGLDLKDSVDQLEHRDVEGAAAEIVDRVQALGTLVEPVREGRRGGLIEEPEDLEARQPTGVLGGLALRVVEVGRHGDDRAIDLSREVRLGSALEVPEDLPRDLDGRDRLPTSHVEAHDARALSEGVGAELGRLHITQRLAHEALDRLDGVGGVAGEVLDGGPAHLDVPVLGVVHHRGQQRGASIVDGNAPRLPLDDGGDEGVGGTEIDPHHRALRLHGVVDLQKTLHEVSSSSKASTSSRNRE